MVLQISMKTTSPPGRVISLGTCVENKLSSKPIDHFVASYCREVLEQSSMKILFDGYGTNDGELVCSFRSSKHSDKIIIIIERQRPPLIDCLIRVESCWKSDSPRCKRGPPKWIFALVRHLAIKILSWFFTSWTRNKLSQVERKGEKISSIDRLCSESFALSGKLATLAVPVHCPEWAW